MPPDSMGANVVPANAKAKVDIAQKCAFVAVETPNAPAKPQALYAPNMDSALQQLGVIFKIQLRRLDGTTQRDTIEIKSLSDFEESTIVRKSGILREQHLRMTFLQNFQNALRNNPRFCEEFKDFLSGEKRDQFVQFLQGWVGQLKQPSSEFLQLLQSN